VRGKAGDSDTGVRHIEGLVKVTCCSLGILEGVVGQLGLGVNSWGLGSVPVKTDLANG